MVEVKAGAKLTLECLVTDARPPASLSWYMNGVRVSPGEFWMIDFVGYHDNQLENRSFRFKLSTSLSFHVCVELTIYYFVILALICTFVFSVCILAVSE